MNKKIIKKRKKLVTNIVNKIGNDLDKLIMVLGILSGDSLPGDDLLQIEDKSKKKKKFNFKKRDHEMWDMLCVKGYKTEKIAKHFSLSTNTVSNNVSKLAKSKGIKTKDLEAIKNKARDKRNKKIIKYAKNNKPWKVIKKFGEESMYGLTVSTIEKVIKYGTTQGTKKK